MIIGVIGGSGLYKLDGVTGSYETVETPYGQTSGKLFKTTLGKHTLYFLPRHGEGHVLTPTEVPYQANIFAFKKLGAQMIISVSAVGSLKTEIAPGHLVLPSQYIDLTKGIRPSTFFGRGVVGHPHFADPTCKTTRDHIAKLAKEMGAKVHHGGTYVCMEGPQFSTRAESNWYRSWNLPQGHADIIGMTALPEAKLAREVGVCYQTIAMATDYDCWNESHGDVSLESIMKVLHQNVDLSKSLIAKLAQSEIPPCGSACREQMKNAIVTPKELWPAHRRAELEIILS